MSKLKIFQKGAHHDSRSHFTITRKLGRICESFGEATQRNVDQVFMDVLEMMWVTLEADYIDLPVSTLSDAEVLRWANIKMDVEQNERLGYLQGKGKTNGLIETERATCSRATVIALKLNQALAVTVRKNWVKAGWHSPND